MHLTPNTTIYRVRAWKTFQKPSLNLENALQVKSLALIISSPYAGQTDLNAQNATIRKCTKQSADFSSAESVTAKPRSRPGTLFHDTRKPLRLWFEAMWHITNQKYGANALGLQRILNLGSYNTAWRWLHKLRRAMVRPGRDNLSGTVEIDETYIGGKRSGKRGRGAENKALVVIAVEDKSDVSKSGKGIGRIRLQHIPDASAAVLDDFVRNNICKGSKLRTDGWSGYLPISNTEYEHVVVGSKDLVIAHLVASLLKRWLIGTYQGAVRPHHLNYYLDEFTWAHFKKVGQI